MSRSYRKPYFTDQQSSRTFARVAKRWASRAIRALTPDAAPCNGKAYRKYFCSYNIRDWSFFSNNPKARRK